MRLSRLLLASLILCGAALAALAQTPGAATVTPYSMSDVTVAPTRVIFEGRTRTSEVALINLSDKTLTYSVSFTHIRMTETGQMQEITDPAPGEQFADDLVRFTPRRVILEPHKTQIVRLQLREPADLPDGEYRSHLAFRVVPSVTQAAGAESPDTQKGISIQLTPVYGVSIPVIVRHGSLSASVALTNLSLSTAPASDGSGGGPQVSFQIDRAGNESVYGNIDVQLLASGKPAQVVGRLNGLAVYTPNASRDVMVSLTIPQGLTLSGARLRVRYLDPASTEGDLTLGSGEIAVP